MLNVHSFRRTVRRFPNRTAIETPDGREFSYADLDARTDALAAALDERLGDGRCAGLLRNGPAAFEAMIGADKRGVATVQLSFRGAPEELAFMIRNADARGLVFDDANAEAALDVIERTDLDAAIHVGDADLDGGTNVEIEPYEAVLEGAAGGYDPERRSGEESAVMYTSGTTSQPKGVLQDQRRAWLASSQAVMEMSLVPDDVLLVSTPWYHDVTTVAWILPCLQVGATMVPHESFDPVETVRAIESHGITAALLVPTQVDAAIDAYVAGDYDVSSLRLVRMGGAIVSPELVERTREHLTEGVHNTYGLTEGFANVTHAYPDEQVENPGTVGNASFVWKDVRVVEAAEPPAEPDPEAVVGPGGTGELIAMGPHTDGYIDRPEAEEELFIDVPPDEEGGSAERWLRTGDIAQIDDAGGLHIVDRIDNMIVSGGENVYPQEVELALMSHPDVEDAAVVGVPHAKWGEQVAAVVVGDVDEDALDQHCLDHGTLADFKRPRQYRFAEEPLPRSDTGTLLRHRIFEEYFE